MTKRVPLAEAAKREVAKDEFVENPQAEEPQSIHTAMQKAAYADRGKIKRATFNFPADLHRELKVAAALEERQMVDLVVEAVRTYLLDRKGKD